MVSALLPSHRNSILWNNLQNTKANVFNSTLLPLKFNVEFLVFPQPVTQPNVIPIYQLTTSLPTVCWVNKKPPVELMSKNHIDSLPKKKVILLLL